MTIAFFLTWVSKHLKSYNWVNILNNVSINLSLFFQILRHFCAFSARILWFIYSFHKGLMLGGLLKLWPWHWYKPTKIINKNIYTKSNVSFLSLRCLADMIHLRTTSAFFWLVTESCGWSLLILGSTLWPHTLFSRSAGFFLLIWLPLYQSRRVTNFIKFHQTPEHSFSHAASFQILTLPSRLQLLQAWCHAQV